MYMVSLFYIYLYVCMYACVWVSWLISFKRNGKYCFLKEKCKYLYSFQYQSKKQKFHLLFFGRGNFIRFKQQ